MSCSRNMNDSQAIHSYLQSQASRCFDLLYNRYSSKVYAKCFSMLRDEAQAEDATQEIFTKIFLNLSKFKANSKFSTWVYSITYNYCIDYIRKKKKQNQFFSDEMEKAGEVKDEIKDEELFQMEVQHLKRVLDEMDNDDRTILLMKYQDELQIKEIAYMLNKTESAIKMRIKRAKEKAKRLKHTLYPDFYS